MNKLKELTQKIYTRILNYLQQYPASEQSVREMDVQIQMFLADGYFTRAPENTFCLKESTNFLIQMALKNNTLKTISKGRKLSKRRVLSLTGSELVEVLCLAADKNNIKFLKRFMRMKISVPEEFVTYILKTRNVDVFLMLSSKLVLTSDQEAEVLVMFGERKDLARCSQMIESGYPITNAFLQSVLKLYWYDMLLYMIRSGIITLDGSNGSIKLIKVKKVLSDLSLANGIKLKLFLERNI